MFYGLSEFNRLLHFAEYRVSVTINLIDVNDEPPRFTMEPSPYLATADAGLPSGSEVNYDITVSDPDANSALKYTMLEGMISLCFTVCSL